MIVVDDEIALQPQIMSIPITLTESKEQGILKRYQASPLPLSILLFTVNSLTALWIGRPLYEQTFVNDPEIVLADEPTGNLDSKTGTEILHLLRHTCDELQATIVMVTHDSQAASFADRIVFLKDGRIIQALPLDDQIPREQHVLMITDTVAGLAI